MDTRTRGSGKVTSGIRRLALGVVVGCALATSSLHGQKLSFARTFDNIGALVDVSKEFKYQPPQQLIAVKFTGRGELPIDTLYVIVKDINGVAGRFYMQRSKRNPSEANAVIKIKTDGIYRVYVYNPARRVRPISHGIVYLTSASYPTKESLLERQRKILVQRGIIKDVNNPNGADPFAEGSTGGNDTPLDQSIDDEFADAGLSLEDDIEGDFADDLADFDEESIGEDDLEADILPEDFAGDFESFDDLDEEFDLEFNIEDF